MSRTNALLIRLDREIERFYFTRARAVIDARLARLDGGLRKLRTAIDRMKSSRTPQTGGTTVASAPKPTLSALFALPGLVRKATLEAEADAEKEAVRFAAAIERKDAAMVRIRDHRHKMENGLTDIEKFADDVDAALGGNGGPKDDPISEGSPPPSDSSPPPAETGIQEAGDTRARDFSSLHPSMRSPTSQKLNT
jgi:hypothetical protein